MCLNISTYIYFDIDIYIPIYAQFDVQVQRPQRCDCLATHVSINRCVCVCVFLSLSMCMYAHSFVRGMHSEDSVLLRGAWIIGSLPMAATRQL